VGLARSRELAVALLGILKAGGACLPLEPSHPRARQAAVLADAGAVALVSLVSPYTADRALARELHEADGLPFLEVYVATPLSLCEDRDPKGLYARARAGELRGFTGVDDPYEPPEAPDVLLCPEEGVAAAAARVVAAVPPVF
jgi:bifunctional enzyme CysN/CysC